MVAPVRRASSQLESVIRHPSSHTRAKSSDGLSVPNYEVMPMHVPTRLRDDRGFLLVEVMVSALLLVVASLAIMTALDKSDALAGNQQKRTMAANIAQAELDM